MYKVKEIYYTLQGEGAQAGRPAVFCRFTGCNLWSGRERDRHKAICQFCDTDFVGTDGENGGKYTAVQLAAKVASLWPKGTGNIRPYVVCTGGEPLLQLDRKLITAFHDMEVEVGIETNGTIAVPDGVDWICVSPKAGTKMLVEQGHELKLVYPQALALPEQFMHLDFQYFFLQPMDGHAQLENTKAAIAYCLAHPQWHLSTQTHKYLNIP
ncbi:MAG: 7-carboxy-7-deazaguanine synthase [Bacteroidota bacterium]